MAGGQNRPWGYVCQFVTLRCKLVHIVRPMPMHALRLRRHPAHRHWTALPCSDALVRRRTPTPDRMVRLARHVAGRLSAASEPGPGIASGAGTGCRALLGLDGICRAARAGGPSRNDNSQMRLLQPPRHASPALVRHGDSAILAAACPASARRCGVRRSRSDLRLPDRPSARPTASRLTRRHLPRTGTRPH
ncbi:hypothetical protein LMG28688_05855 [Paraburkholderia caffeinitolerans]|uniref:Uncharacterized protein n=1 Tax=Paraburkholderia caffeinitolerans TaxID=1723730 RepID=A0A6J5GUB9_9BURK|nr:hypothetical protein LMG28688_05855 [Paraburkholderia caffeinitolerans]